MVHVTSTNCAVWCTSCCRAEPRHEQLRALIRWCKVLVSCASKLLLICRYAVATGRETGVFNTWPECQAQVSGYKGAVFKSFASKSDAEAFCRGGGNKGRGGYSTNVKAPQFKSTTRPAQRAVHPSIHNHAAEAAQAQGYEAQMV